MDDLEALLGAMPTDADRQKLIAQVLRGRRSVGELGAISGDRALAPFGQQMVNQSYRTAEGLQQIRQNDIDDARTQKYYNDQMSQARENASDRRSNDRMNWMLRAAEIQANLEEARIRAAGSQSRRKMTDSTRNKIAETSSVYEGISGLEKGFKPEYTQIFGAGPQSLLPNYGAQFGIGSKQSKEAQQWWATWNEIRTLPWRNLLFGATLTPNEKIEWQKVDINPSMSPQQIAEGVARIKGIIKNKARNHARVMQADGYDPEDILIAYGEDLLFDDLDDASAASGTDAEIAELERMLREGEVDGQP